MNTLKSLSLMASLVFLLGLGCSHTPSPAEFQDKELVVLLHGFGRSKSAMWRLDERLEEAGYVVHRVGYSSLTQDMSEIESEVHRKINELTFSTATKVHFVGHSLGGLLIRSYLGAHQPSNLGHVVLLGSPNQGTPVIDHMKERWWFFILGPAAVSLSANGSDFLAKLKKPNYPLGVIAGNAERPGDEHIMQGEDDGLVPLESTKVEGMQDFLVVDSGHARLRSDPQVAFQTIQFLRRGRFERAPSPVTDSESSL